MEYIGIIAFTVWDHSFLIVEGQKGHPRPEAYVTFNPGGGKTGRQPSDVYKKFVFDKMNTLKALKLK